VQMLGVNIGRVLRFAIAPSGVDIRLEIEGEYEIPVDSRVELQSAGPLGGMIARIIPGKSTTMISGGEQLAGALIPDIMSKADDISAQAQKTMARVQALLSEKMVKG